VKLPTAQARALKIDAIEVKKDVPVHFRSIAGGDGPDIDAIQRIGRGLGAAQAGFMMSSQTMVLEFGLRHDTAMRLGLSQTAQGVMNTLGPLLGGVIASTLGYRPLFVLSMVFEAVALALLLTVVDEPRTRAA